MSEHRYKNALDVGYSSNDLGRFRVLDGLKFNSVLDVGSGPCLLHGWIVSNRVEASYDAFDIRAESLSFCRCPVHFDFPVGRKFDLVCLFGTTGYDAHPGTDRSKEMYANLLMLSASSASRYLVFTLMKDFEEEGILGGRNVRGILHYGILHYPRREATEVASSLGASYFTTPAYHELTEHLFICHM